MHFQTYFKYILGHFPIDDFKSNKMRSSMLDENSYSFENQQVTPTFVEHKQIENNRRSKGNSSSNSVSYINFP